MPRTIERERERVTNTPHSAYSSLSLLNTMTHGHSVLYRAGSHGYGHVYGCARTCARKETV